MMVEWLVFSTAAFAPIWAFQTVVLPNGVEGCHGPNSRSAAAFSSRQKVCFMCSGHAGFRGTDGRLE